MAAIFDHPAPIRSHATAILYVDLGNPNSCPFELGMSHSRMDDAEEAGIPRQPFYRCNGVNHLRPGTKRRLPARRRFAADGKPAHQSRRRTRANLVHDAVARLLAGHEHFAVDRMAAVGDESRRLSCDELGAAHSRFAVGLAGSPPAGHTGRLFSSVVVRRAPDERRIGRVDRAEEKRAGAVLRPGFDFMFSAIRGSAHDNSAKAAQTRRDSLVLVRGNRVYIGDVEQGFCSRVAGGAALDPVVAKRRNQQARLDSLDSICCGGHLLHRRKFVLPGARCERRHPQRWPARPIARCRRSRVVLSLEGAGPFEFGVRLSAVDGSA